jgi:hypothetical protein
MMPKRRTPISSGSRIRSLLCLLLLAVSGCASYSSKVSSVKEYLASGEVDRALEEVEESKSGSSRALFLMEKGLLLHYAGRFEESNQTFEEAEILIEDLYTKSLSREIGAFLTSDNVREYDGEEFERVWINYYRALNYIYLGLPEDALVECRKVNLKLRRYMDDKGEEPGESAYPNDAFIQYLTGILYEWRGDVNDAHISYRAAAQAYDFYRERYGLDEPEGLDLSLLRTAEELGFRDEFTRYRDQCPEIEDGAWRRQSDQGELIFLHENGYIPHKIERNLNVPILKNDDWDDDRQFAMTLTRRARPGYRAEKIKVDYWLRLALPEYAPEAPRIAYAELSAPGHQTATVTVENLGAIARATLEEKYGTILFRTILRALAKYGAHEAAESKSATLGVLTNILGVATESADTRSWLTLPCSVGMARLELPEGTHRIELIFYDEAGLEVHRDTLEDVEIHPGDTTFLSYRTFQ